MDGRNARGHSNRKKGPVFYADHTGMNEHLPPSGFETACRRTKIPFGVNVEGGVIWPDLRSTVANELRAQQVHEYDIAYDQRS